MLAQIGQRWMFESKEIKYIIEITDFSLENVRGRVVQLMRGGGIIESLGYAIPPKKEINDSFVCGSGTWSYLKGQDAP